MNILAVVDLLLLATELVRAGEAILSRIRAEAADGTLTDERLAEMQAEARTLLDRYKIATGQA